MSQLSKFLKADNQATGNPLKDIMRNDNPLSYDQSFISDDIINDSTEDSMFLSNRFNPFNNVQEGGANEFKAQNQPWGFKIGAGIGRIGLKVASEVAKMPGVIGGVIAGGIGQLDDAITGEDNTDFIKTAFDNRWINAVQGVEDYLKDEVLPVYVKKSVKEGNLWDNITSADFWANEGADGIGYIISMLVPGSVINKYGLGAKLLGTSKYAQMAAKSKYADEILKGLKKIDSPLSPTSVKNADLFTGTMANTLFEAGAEAKGAMDSYEEELNQKLSTGQITKAQFDKDIAKSSEIGRNVFLTNALVLVGPNALMSKMLWGKPRNKAIGAINGTGKLEALNNLTLKQRIGKGAKELIKGSISEGLWEEGMQSTAETYFTENPDSSLLDFVGDIPNAYADMFSSTDGQKAMFLGALFGGGMSVYHDAKNYKKEKTATDALISSGNEVLEDAYSIFQKDIYEKKDGKIVYTEKLEDGVYKKVPKVDTKALQEKIKGSNQLDYLSGMYDLASEVGDVDLMRDIKQKVFTDLIKPFVVNEQLGLDVLKQHLEASSELASINERDNTENKKFIDDILEQAKKLEEDNTTFQSFAPSIFKLEHPKATDEHKSEFYRNLTNKYLNNKSSLYYNQKKLQEKKASLELLLEETGTELSELEKEKTLKEQLNFKDTRLTKVYKEIKDLEAKIKDNKKVNNAFWDNKTVSKIFKSQVNESIKAKEEEEKIEAKSNEVLELIKNATTLSELDSITIPDNIAAVSIKDTLEKKRNEITEAQQKAIKEASAKSENFTQEQIKENAKAEQALTYLSENFNVGETVTIPAVKGIPEKRQGLSAEITDIKSTHVSFKTEDGEVFAFKATTFAGAINTSNFVTEGPVENTVQEVVEDNSATVYEEKNQPRIIITDNNEGKKLSFISEAALEFERSPVDKVGQEKGIELNKGFSANQNKALEMINANNFSDIDFLIDHLPLNIKLTDDVVAPIETKSETSDSYNTIFNKTSKELRTTIVKELAKGTKLEDITVPIAGQANGTIQLEEKVEENVLTGLYEFGGDLSKIKKEDIYFVDSFGTLVNSNEDIFPTKNALAPGEVYIKIHTAAGIPFPLKLNVKRLTEEKAGLLYELYKSRFTGEDINTLSSLEAPLWESIKSNFGDVLNLLDKNIDDVTIKDLIEFLVWEGSKNPKTQVKFTTKNTLLLLDKELTQKQFETPESKDLFIHTLSNPKTGKRHQIKFRRKETDSNNLNIDENRKYLEYLITSGTLNTNAKVGEPTFQGKTTLYLGKDQVKVNGKLSEFNEDLVKVYKKIAKPEVKPVKETPVKKEPKEVADKFKGVEITDNKALDAITAAFGNTILPSKPKAPKENKLKEEPSAVPLTKLSIDFDNLSSQEAFAIYAKLSMTYKSYLKEIQSVTKEHNTKQAKAKAVFELLKNKGISEEEIKTACK